MIQKMQASNEDIIEYLKRLTIFSTYYIKLLDPDKEQEQSIRERLKRLNRIQVTTAYPFLLNIYHDYINSKLTLTHFVRPQGQV